MSDPLADYVARAQSGDSQAFARLVTETQTDTYNLAYSVVRNHQEAQDLAQEVYLRVWRALPAFRGEAKFQSWIYRITINTCLNRRRQLRKQLQRVDRDDALDCIPASQVLGPAQQTLARDQYERLWSAVDQLGEKYRLVISLFYRQQLSYQEIADLLDLPLGTVKAHLSRARKALAQTLLEKEERDAYL